MRKDTKRDHNGRRSLSRVALDGLKTIGGVFASQLQCFKTKQSITAAAAATGVEATPKSILKNRKSNCSRSSVHSQTSDEDLEENDAKNFAEGVAPSETKVYQLRCLNNSREEVEFWITPPQSGEAKGLIWAKRKEKEQVYKIKYGKVAEDVNDGSLARSPLCPDGRGEVVQPANLYETEVCAEELPALMHSLLNGSIATSQSN